MRSKSLLSVAFFVAALAAASPIFAAGIGQLSTDGSIDVESAWARLAPKEPDTASVFFEVLNVGNKPDVLLSAYSPAAKKVTLRRGEWSGWDFFNREADGIKINANKRVSFHPGALEVTLNEFTEPVDVRSVLPVTLVFKEAGPVTIEATVSNQLLGNRIAK
jgi:periplasmic copper chaperone A